MVNASGLIEMIHYISLMVQSYAVLVGFLMEQRNVVMTGIQSDVGKLS
jgi:hypothetical protein